MSPTQLRSCRQGTLAALLCVALLPAAASAQNWDVAGQVGVGIPVGDLSDTHGAGFSASLSTTRWLSSRYGIRVGGAGNFLGGDNSNIPDLKIWHYNGGLEFDLLAPRAQKLKWHANVGIGGTTTQVDGGGDSSDFAINAGTNIEWPLNEYFRIIGGPAIYVTFADDTQTIVPFTAGFRYLFSTP